ncbi:hypothetical protein C5Y97_21955 [Blastopirellula marina]|uniref:Uncharacterized protein n=2 Tax=Blastopirellula marina TaxID=124 RepID=A0A2S8FCP8_9BACT|nr:hypothetical protein C5Y98_21945 [Blastopirellula marina]PTL42396.1 hypothetical protein C5Y97_21955 [Blastopirellula marina]
MVPPLLMAQKPDGDSAAGEEVVPLDEQPGEAKPDEAAQPDFDKMSARQFFELIDFGESYLAMLVDGEELGISEQEAIIRGLTRIRRLQPHRITHWLELQTPWQELAEHPAQHRLEIFLLTGKVEAVRRQMVPEEAVSTVAMASYYEVDVRLDQESGTAPGTIVVENIPAAWQANLDQPEALQGQPISCPGIFLKTFQAEGGETGYVFATSKLSWHPDQVNPRLDVTPAKVRLAKQGMDIGELAFIQDRAKLEGREREPFYQMLATVSRLPKDQQTATIAKSVSELLTLPKNGLMVAPEAYRAEFIDLAGVCRRITRIEIDDEDIEKRLGIDHYYEVSIFVPIPTPIVSQRPGDEASRKEFAHEYPVLVCVPTLPKGIHEGDELHLSVAATGAFFKLWAHRTLFMSGQEHTRRQISPLFVASELRKHTVESDPQVNQFVLAMLLILSLVIGIGVAMGMIFSRKPSSRRR